MQHKEKIILYIWLSSLIVIVLIGVIFCFQRPPENIISANREVLSIAQKIRTHYSNRPDYWGLDTNEVIKQKLHHGKVTNNQIINNLGKNVIIGSDSKGTQVMPGMHSFMITYTSLTKQECIELSSFHLSEEEKLGLLSMAIRNNQGIYEFSWGDKGLPLPKGVAKQYCQEENDVIWSFE